MQVQEHIFSESNKLSKSIQVFLNALNELRLCYVMERSSSVPSIQESSKVYHIQTIHIATLHIAFCSNRFVLL